MNHIIINKLSDLHKVIESPIVFSHQKRLIDEEIYPNMWMLTFEDDLIKKVSIDDLVQFLSQLLRKHQAQLNQIDSHQSATFYLWFDEQALQLRFNLLFGSDLTLPFRSKINVIDSPNPILKDFITTGLSVATEGDVVEFIKPYEDQDDDEEEYVLDVFVKILNPEL